MSTSFSYFSNGIAKAYERRAMQQHKKEYAQSAQQIDTAIINTITKQSAKKIDGDAYKESLLCKMRKRLAQMKADDNNRQTNHKE